MRTDKYKTSIEYRRPNNDPTVQVMHRPGGQGYSWTAWNDDSNSIANGKVKFMRVGIIRAWLAVRRDRKDQLRKAGPVPVQL